MVPHHRFLCALAMLSLMLDQLSAFTTTFPAHKPHRALHRPAAASRRLPALRVAGAHMSADQDETRAMLVNQFRKLDKGAGTLSSEQVKDVLIDLKYSPEEASCIFQQMDVDGNGQISELEFLGACESSGVCAIELSQELSQEASQDADEEPADAIRVKGARGAEVDGVLKEMFARMTSWVRSAPSATEKLSTGEIISCKSRAEFEEYIRKAGNTPVCVIFAATYCRKCMALKPKMSRIVSGYEGRVVFLRVMIDEVEKSLIKEVANVVAVPTFQVWKNGKMEAKYVAGPSVGEVASFVVKMIDSQLEDFSLMDKVNEAADKAEAEGVKAEAEVPQEKEKVQLAEGQVNDDAMTAWRKAQAAKSTRTIIKP